MNADLGFLLHLKISQNCISFISETQHDMPPFANPPPPLQPG